MIRATAFVAGIVFAWGLGISGMTQPAKVTGFLDFWGAWDPSLAWVMVGAIGVHFALLRVTRRWSRPVYAARFDEPARRVVDRRLIVGAALFGAGWGLAGYCPGPAIVSIASGSSAVVLVLAMLLGVLLHEWQQRRHHTWRQQTPRHLGDRTSCPRTRATKSSAASSA